MINITIKDKGVKNLLADIEKKVRNLKPAMGLIGEIVQESVERNFEEGGRPKKWKRLLQATIRQRIKKRSWPGQVLVIKGKAGGLMGGINYRPERDRVTIGVKKAYAATHHFGSKKRNIPARPFMMVQREDWGEIRESLADYIMGKGQRLDS